MPMFVYFCKMFRHLKNSLITIAWLAVNYSPLILDAKSENFQRKNIYDFNF